MLYARVIECVRQLERSMPHIFQIQALAVALVFHSACLATELPESAGGKLTPAEMELIALADDFSSELDIFLKHTQRTAPGEAEAYASQHSPAIEFLPKLLAFERAHAGHDVGLDALGEVVSFAARGGGPESHGALARREVLSRLGAYEQRELAIGVLYSLASGDYDQNVIEYLKRLAVSQRAHPTVRQTGRYVLAKALLSLRNIRAEPEQRVNARVAGEEPRLPQETELIRDDLSSLPSAVDIASGIDEANAILEELAASGELYQMPVIRTVDPTGRIARVDVERSKSGNYLSEMASALLFKEQHLRVGQQAPDLEINLVDGALWTLASQRSRVVIIQFSFTGCGACETMYPNLRELHEAYSEKLSIVSIMRDGTPAPSIKAVEAGKLTWNVACDGSPGQIASRWAVDSFPTLYVIDQAGRIAFANSGDEELKAKVSELLEVGQWPNVRHNDSK
jgi:peroxiredoxin